MENLAHYVRVYDNVFDKDFCDSLIEVFDYCKETEKDTMRHSEFHWDWDYRSFYEVDITKTPEFKPFIDIYYARVKQVYEQYTKSVDNPFFPTNCELEDGRMKKYEVNGHDQFGWHTDVGDKASASRFLVMFLYLNDVEEGGRTLFETDSSNTKFTIKPKLGRMVIFPPMFMYPHKGEKPVSNPKYILSTYAHYK